MDIETATLVELETELARHRAGNGNAPRPHADIADRRYDNALAGAIALRLAQAALDEESAGWADDDGQSAYEAEVDRYYSR